MKTRRPIRRQINKCIEPATQRVIDELAAKRRADEELQIKDLIKKINEKNNKVVGKEMSHHKRSELRMALTTAAVILARIKSENTTSTNKWAATAAFATEFQKDDYATTHLLDQKDKEMALNYQTSMLI